MRKDVHMQVHEDLRENRGGGDDDDDDDEN